MNNPTISHRLRKLSRVWRGYRSGGSIQPHQVDAFERELGECIVAVERMELEGGRPDIVTQLKRAGRDVARLRAALGGRHVQ